ncbi:MAG: hypothetical protein EA412_03775 [Chitinophagaceae bacterium]|nr:MAG: hypothetical protein EA412_03775 [Chitinophagaceae bacterium]
MFLKKGFCSAIFFLIIPFFALSQSRGNPTEILYNNERSGGASISTNGWSVFYETGKIQTINSTRIWSFEFAQLKHAKERKQPAELTFTGSFFENKRDFFYGKQNNFYTFRVGYGFKRMLGDRANKSGVRVSYTYMGGLSLGILKPYYLNLVYQNRDTQNRFEIRPERYTDENAAKYLDWFSISGASPFRYGLNEIEPVPGVFGRVGLHFDWAAMDEFITALELGVNLDVFYKNIPIMITEDNKPYFLGGYLQLKFGKRTN